MFKKFFVLFLVVSLVGSLFIFGLADSKQLSDEYIRNRNERRAQFDRLQGAMEQELALKGNIPSDHKTLSYYYGGAYIDEKDNLVVQVTDDSKEIVAKVREFAGSKNLEVVKCKYSEAELVEVINTLISFHNEIEDNGIYIDMYFDDIKNGTVCIVGQNFNDETKAIIKSYVDFDSFEFIESKAGFKNDEIRVRENILSNEEALRSAYPLAGGDLIYAHPDGTSKYFTQSLGFGATRSGEVGLVTVSHGDVGTGDHIHITKGSRFGTITAYKNSGSTDAAFAEKGNNDYTVSSHLQGGRNISYASTNLNFPVGDSVTKVGGKSGDRSGDIVSNNGAADDGSFTGLLVCNFIVEGGDSGSPLVMHDYGNNYILTGIIKGNLETIHGDFAIASKYRHIKNDLGINAIVSN